jgi:hypothetical protein
MQAQNQVLGKNYIFPPPACAAQTIVEAEVKV